MLKFLHSKKILWFWYYQTIWEKVSHEFLFTYNGKRANSNHRRANQLCLYIVKVEPTQLNPGDTGILTVKFNLIFWRAWRKFSRSWVSLWQPLSRRFPVKIWTEIDLGPWRRGLLNWSPTMTKGGRRTWRTLNIILLLQRYSLMLKEKDFVLIDTHIPEQNHIAGTDEFIPYDEILQSSKLQQIKTRKIVLYCQVEVWGRAAACNWQKKDIPMFMIW